MGAAVTVANGSGSGETTPTSGKFSLPHASRSPRFTAYNIWQVSVRKKIPEYANYYNIPSILLITVAYDAVELRSMEHVTLCRFPFEDIALWGYSPTAFKLSVISPDRSKLIHITLETLDGKVLDQVVSSSVHKFIAYEAKEALTSAELSSLFEELSAPTEQPRDDEGHEEKSDSTGRNHHHHRVQYAPHEVGQQLLDIIEKRTAHRILLSAHAVNLFSAVETQMSGFERCDLACLLHERMRGSFDIILDRFEDPQDRQNVLARLHLHPGAGAGGGGGGTRSPSAASTSSGSTTSAPMLPMGLRKITEKDDLILTVSPLVDDNRELQQLLDGYDVGVGTYTRNNIAQNNNNGCSRNSSPSHERAAGSRGGSGNSSPARGRVGK